MNDNQLKSLVANGKYESVIKRLLEVTDDGDLYNELLSLSGRITTLERNRLQNLVDNSSYTTQRNVLVQSTLQYIDLVTSQSDGNLFNLQSTSYDTSELENIAKKYKRRDPSISETALILIGKFQEYQVKKNTQSGFDPVGRRLSILTTEAETLLKRVKELEVDSKESKVATIKGHLDRNLVPETADLLAAWQVAKGMGMSDNDIESELNSNPNAEQRIVITEKIEAFIESL